MANEFRFEDHPDAAKFRPIADAAIDDFAAKHGFEFSDEYLAFLKRHNGFDFDRLNEAAPLGPGIETFDDIRYLFGIDTGFEYNDLRAYLSLPGAWETAVSAFSYPIAEGPGGDPIIQIFKGKAKGKIYFVDHEVFPDAGELEREGINAASLDQVLSFLVDVQGCFIEVAGSFSAQGATNDRQQ